jgi:hypothetical protein
LSTANTAVPIRIKTKYSSQLRFREKRIGVILSHFLSKQNTGPVTLNGEYLSIMRMRSLVRLISGFSSALKTVGGATPNSRAASTLDFPASSLNFFASAANSVSSNMRSAFIMQNETEDIYFGYFFLAVCLCFLI